MAAYIVIFEVANAENRTKIRDALKTFGGYCPLTASSWAIGTAKKATEVTNELKKYIAKGDRIYVLKSGGEGAWVNSMGDKHTEWLKKNL